MACTSGTSSVCLVHLVGLMQPNKPDRPNRPNEQNRLADFFSILLEGKGQLKKLQGALRGRHCRVGSTFGISRNPDDRPQFLQRSPADAAMVPPRLNRPPLASVHSAALPTTPGKSRQGEDFLLQRMVDSDRQGAVPIHLGHLAEKSRPMIRPPLQDVVLPLMNHFVRQRIDDLLLAILAPSGDLLEQGKGQANFALGRRAKTILVQSRPRSSTTHEYADRGGQLAAPDEIDRGQ